MRKGRRKTKKRREKRSNRRRKRRSWEIEREKATWEEKLNGGGDFGQKHEASPCCPHGTSCDSLHPTWFPLSLINKWSLLLSTIKCLGRPLIQAWGKVMQGWLIQNRQTRYPVTCSYLNGALLDVKILSSKFISFNTFKPIMFCLWFQCSCSEFWYKSEISSFSLAF